MKHNPQKIQKAKNTPAPLTVAAGAVWSFVCQALCIGIVGGFSWIWGKGIRSRAFQAFHADSPVLFGEKKLSKLIAKRGGVGLQVGLLWGFGLVFGVCFGFSSVCLGIMPL